MDYNPTRKRRTNKMSTRKLVEVIEMPLQTVGGVQNGTKNRMEWYKNNNIDCKLLDCPMWLWNAKISTIIKSHILNIMNIFRIINLISKGYKKFHFHGVNSGVIGVLLRKYIDPYITLHGVQVYTKVGLKSKIQDVYYSIMNKYVLKNMFRIMAISEFEIRYYSQFTNKKIVLIRNAVNSKLYEYDWKYDSSKPIVLFVGRLYPGSSAITFLKSYKYLLTKNIEYLVVGDGVLGNELRQQYSNNKMIKFVGMQKDVMPFLLKSRLMVSHIDHNIIGFGNNIMEAFCCGLPVIYGRDYVNANLVGGLVIDKNDPEMLAKIIDKFIYDKDWLDIQSNVEKRFIKDFYMDNIYPKIMEQIFETEVN